MVRVVTVARVRFGVACGLALGHFGTATSAQEVVQAGGFFRRHEAVVTMPVMPNYGYYFQTWRPFPSAPPVAGSVWSPDGGCAPGMPCFVGNEVEPAPTSLPTLPGMPTLPVAPPPAAMPKIKDNNPYGKEKPPTPKTGRLPDPTMMPMTMAPPALVQTTGGASPYGGNTAAPLLPPTGGPVPPRPLPRLMPTGDVVPLQPNATPRAKLEPEPPLLPLAVPGLPRAAHEVTLPKGN